MLPVNPYDQNTSFWARYILGRPKVPDAFFERIFAYHESHSGSFNVVHDAGAGPAIHSARLAKRFAHVLVSDPVIMHIGEATKRLKADRARGLFDCLWDMLDYLFDFDCFRKYMRN